MPVFITRSVLSRVPHNTTTGGLLLSMGKTDGWADLRCVFTYVQSDAAIEEACREAGVVNDHQVSQIKHGWMREKWSKVTKKAISNDAVPVLNIVTLS